jgi:hypothetical protein
VASCRPVMISGNQAASPTSSMMSAKRATIMVRTPSPKKPTRLQPDRAACCASGDTELHVALAVTLRTAVRVHSARQPPARPPCLRAAPLLRTAARVHCARQYDLLVCAQPHSPAAVQSNVHSSSATAASTNSLSARSVSAAYSSAYPRPPCLRTACLTRTIARAHSAPRRPARSPCLRAACLPRWTTSATCVGQTSLG